MCYPVFDNGCFNNNPRFVRNIQFIGRIFQRLVSPHNQVQHALDGIYRHRAPPAAGTALGSIVHGWSTTSLSVIIIGAIAVSGIRVILKSKLVNLL